MALLLALLALAPGWLAAGLGEPEVRVLVLEGASQVDLAGEDLFAVDSVTGRRVFQRAGPGGLTVSLGPHGVVAGGLSLGVPSVEIASGSVGLVTMGSRTYRGPVTLLKLEGRLAVINRLPLERYLIGLVASEMPTAWPLEALKAQAVVARSYALSRMAASGDQPFDLRGTVLDQAYGGAGAEDERALQAVQATEGQVLRLDGVLVETYYHAICGGMTEDPSAVWAGRGGFPQPVRCTRCLDAPGAQWEARIDATALADALRPMGFKDAVVLTVVGARRSAGQRWETVRVSGSSSSIVVPGNELRRVVGFSKLKSLRFEVSVAQGVVRFKGSGFGHGVGMCQWGARGMAAEGAGYEQILSHYYPGATLGRR